MTTETLTKKSTYVKEANKFVAKLNTATRFNAITGKAYEIRKGYTAINGVMHSIEIKIRDNGEVLVFGTAFGDNVDDVDHRKEAPGAQ